MVGGIINRHWEGMDTEHFVLMLYWGNWKFNVDVKCPSMSGVYEMCILIIMVWVAMHQLKVWVFFRKFAFGFINCLIQNGWRN